MNKITKRPPSGPKGDARPNGSDMDFALYVEDFMTDAIERLNGQNRAPDYKLSNDIRDMELVTAETDAALKTYVSNRTQQFEYAFGMIIRAADNDALPELQRDTKALLRKRRIKPDRRRGLFQCVAYAYCGIRDTSSVKKWANAAALLVPHMKTMADLPRLLKLNKGIRNCSDMYLAQKEGEEINLKLEGGGEDDDPPPPKPKPKPGRGGLKSKVSSSGNDLDAVAEEEGDRVHRTGQPKRPRPQAAQQRQPTKVTAKVSEDTDDDVTEEVSEGEKSSPSDQDRKLEVVVCDEADDLLDGFNWSEGQQAICRLQYNDEKVHVLDAKFVSDDVAEKAMDDLHDI